MEITKKIRLSAVLTLSLLATNTLAKVSIAKGLAAYMNEDEVCKIISAKELQNILKLSTTVNIKSNGSGSAAVALCSYAWRQSAEVGSFTVILSPFDSKIETFPPKRMNAKELDQEVAKQIQLMKKMPSYQNMEINKGQRQAIATAIKANNNYEFIASIGDGVTVSQNKSVIVLTAVVGNIRFRINAREKQLDAIKKIAKYILE